MSTITLNIGAQVNQPPSSSGWASVALDYNELYVFTLAYFTTNTNPPYADPEGDVLESVKVTTIPSQGVLSLSAIPVINNDVITSADIVAGNLKYQADVADTDGYESNDMMFTVSDVGSSTFTLTPTRFIFAVDAQENQPPTSVGDGSTTVEYSVVKTLTRAMFTSGTIPAYSDPESDEAFNLRFDTVPILGELQINGELITAGQIVSFSDIDLGLLTYVGDLTDTDGDVQSFTFSIADAGSLNFTS
jgi:hypothetical protein